MRALILGASGGIGGAVAARLRDGGGHVTGLSRSADGLDLTEAATLQDHATRLAGQEFDLIFNATGALMIGEDRPEKSFEAARADAMARQFALNATGVALAIRYFAPLLAGDRRAVFASLSARVGSIGDNRLGGWFGYRAAKAAQNQIIRCGAIEWRRRNARSIFVALHPGTVTTPLTARYADRYPTISPARSAEALLSVIDGLTPQDSGGFYDWKGQRIEW
ncbi:SDR family NAD(P)-dependent oxidoreductase [Paracoccus stylophorae]